MPSSAGSSCANHGALVPADNVSKGGFDYFEQIEALQRQLSAILGCTVDVIEEPVRKQRLQAEIDRDRSFAFQPRSRPLQDIIDNAQAIFALCEGMDLAAFEENRLVYDTVEGCTERITEASTKLGDMALYLLPDQPWRQHQRRPAV